MARLLDFIPAVLARIPDSDAVVFAPIREATREFCQKTSCWRVSGLSGDIISVTREAVGVFNSKLHSFRGGETVLLSGFLGMTELNGLTVTVKTITPDTFSVNLVTNGASSATSLDTTSFGTYTSGGGFESLGINVVSGDSKYRVYTPLETVPCSVKRVMYKSRLLNPSGVKDLDSGRYYPQNYVQALSYPNWESQSGQPISFMMETNNTVRLYPIPSESVLGALKVTTAVKPSAKGTFIADDVFEQYHDAIVKGAVSKLLAQSNQDWYDRAGSHEEKKEFEKEILATKNRIMRNMNGTSIYLKQGNYVGKRSHR